MNLISSQQSFRNFSQFMVFHVFSPVFEIHIHNEGHHMLRLQVAHSLIEDCVQVFFSYNIFVLHKSVNSFLL